MDPYCEKMQVFIEQAGRQVEDMQKKLENIYKIYAESCEYYLIDKTDEKSTNSQEYFKFFTGFVDQVIKSMPKEEKKRTAAKKPDGASAGGAGPAKKFDIGGQKPGMGNLMAELKLKQGGQ